MEESVRSPDVPSAPPFVGDLVICLGGGHLPGPAALEGGIGPGCAGRPGLQRANWVTGSCRPARLITRFPRRVLVPGVRLATLEGSYGWPDDAAVPGPAVAVGGASSCCFMPAQTVCPWRLPIRAITGASSLTAPLGRTCHDHRIRGPAPTGSNVSVPLMRPGALLVPGPAAPAGLGDLHGAHRARVILRLIPLAGDVAQHHLHGPADDFTRLSKAHRIDLGQTEPPPRAQPQAIRNVHVLTSVGQVGELISGTWNHGSFAKKLSNDPERAVVLWSRPATAAGALEARPAGAPIPSGELPVRLAGDQSPPSPLPRPSPWPCPWPPGCSGEAAVTAITLPAGTGPLGCTDSTVPGSWLLGSHTSRTTRPSC